MDTLKYLIGFFLKIASLFFFMAFVWWLMSLLYPEMGYKNLLPYFSMHASSTAPKKDILPSPKQYSGLFARKGSVAEGNLFKPGPAYNGYGNVPAGANYKYTEYNYVTYSASGTKSVYETSYGTQVKQAQVNSQPTALAASSTPSNRTLYVRNLSIYEGGHIYTGLSFIGEARSSMFREGKFPIVMVDGQGKVIGVSAAVAQTSWTVPGWVRFQTKIEYALPRNANCTMVFEEAQTGAERAARMPVRVPIATQCN